MYDVDIGCKFFEITLHVMCRPIWQCIYLVASTATRVVRKYNINIPLICRQTDNMSFSAIVEQYSKVEYKKYCIIFNGHFSVYLIELLRTRLYIPCTDT